MPRPLSIPAYTLHKATGQARVRINNKDHYLGLFGTKNSRDLYDSLIAEWTAEQSVDKKTISVALLCLRYTEHAKIYYCKNGKPTSEQENIRVALRYLVATHGKTRARLFGPVALREVRAAMIAAGCVRTSINRMVGRVKRVFRWGVSQELIPGASLVALDSVDGLAVGRTEAIESERVTEVDITLVNAIQPYVSRQIWAMIQLQLLTAARPGEIRLMRGCDLTASGDLLEYRPESHKTQHHGRERVIFLNQKAQEIVSQFLRVDDPEAYLFSPADARQEYHDKRRENRKTPVCREQMKRQTKKDPAKKPGMFYTDKAYCHAVAVACKKAGADHWHPHQLRHTRATEIRARFGLEAAQVVLGQAHAKTAEIYAARDQQKAKRVIRKMT